MMDVIGYKPKSREDLFKAIDNCVSISQLFALVQHEKINIQMRTLNGASNIQPKKLSPEDFIPNKSPLDKLKEAVKQAVENR